jgi:hypothetical protein
LVDRVLFRNEESTWSWLLGDKFSCRSYTGFTGKYYSDVVFKTTRISCGLDAGSAQLVGVLKMIRALQRLKSAYHGQLLAQLSAVSINGSKGTRWIQHGFMSHPPLKERIEVLCKSA